jgi:serine/threonine protein kinase
MLYENLIVDNIYQVIEEIGSGGMGVVYLAYHLRLEKYVVMKKIKNSYADISMLRNEVDILKELHHPYLPQVYDFIKYDGDIYTIIDYIDGYDLNYYINNNYIFAESQLIKWLRQLCEVLEYLHSQNPQILHTDIKPGNIIVTGSGDICLIDFGISLYSTDLVKGLSENYSSPEQFAIVQGILSNSQEPCFSLDERTDIYSLAATFYHLMTGVKPNIRNSEQPSISQYELEYSETFVAIIDKAMAYDREKRFKNASQLIKAIDNMCKLDSRYRHYVLIQIISSVLAGLMIVSGVSMMFFGYRNKLVEQYEADYNQFIALYNSANTEEATELGCEIVNNSDYDFVLDNDTKAKILHAIGDCYFDNNDYYNSAYYYKLAVNFLSDEEDSSIYYRDYLFALINDNRLDEAQSELTLLMQKFSDDALEALVEAEISYKSNDFSQAINEVDDCIDSFLENSENLYTAYIIKGDSYNALGDYKNSVEAYTNAINNKETVTALRKLGNASLKYADKYKNVNYYNQSLDCFNKINDEYSSTSEDIINLAQTYLLRGRSEDYEACKKLLKGYLNANGDDCRMYIILAIASSVTQDSNTSSYCLSAHKLYYELSDDEKASIDSNSMAQIKALYKKYCGQVW